MWCTHTWLRETHRWDALQTVFLPNAEATTRVPRAHAHISRFASRVHGLQARSRGPPLLGELTICGIVPDQPLPGDFNDLRDCAGWAPPERLTTALYVGAVPCKMPLLLALKTHYILPIPEMFSRNIRSQLNEAGEERAIAARGRSSP